MKFVLDGCDISFIAEAPEDITLKELLKQTNRLKPDWCACGIRLCDEDEIRQGAEVIITRDSIRLADDGVPATIKER